ncbi:MAG TPA: hypothetical protein VEQ35_05715 [Beijerinckia sp.]|jgi:protein ImuA|nr:hypothetical protein [Beijerinckia sp.]
MSQGGSSEVLEFLREKIARIEADGSEGAGFARPAAPARISLGESLGENFSLDRVLQGGLTRGALYEIVAGRPGDGAAASGFALALAARFAAQNSKAGASIVWISEDFAGRENGLPYGPGLQLHGIDPARLVLVHALNAKESLWCMEEALRCKAVAAVIMDLWNAEKSYDLVASRRLVLAAQKSGTPGLLLAAGMAGKAASLSTAAKTRFEIFSGKGLQLASAGSRMPLPGLAAWSVRIAKARAGPEASGFDRDKVFAVFWDHEEACFRDAFSLALASHSRDRPGRPADARARSWQSA